MIRIQSLNKRYGERSVLQDLNMHLAPGEFAFLQGRSGSGKSTLLKLLYRDIGDFSGQIEIAGKPIESIPKYELRRKIGVIFQSFELLERKTVFENIALAGEVVGVSHSDMVDEINRLLLRVGLQGREEAFPDQLSGGELQRVAIVRALLNRPALILADEPTGNLDSETASDIIRLLLELQAESQLAMLVVTHSDRLVAEFPSKAWKMIEGRVTANELI
ncbi:cell division ATP-binding protein FtsE [Paenibacillus agricola]|uniref:ATP-binding cassette domain-containing protein n=1 Tax=Paenibacillus agricola TaxID=2716264 RepID=A0ABX0JBD2_9BACL|nr:ATP-binding cassette domain-containing protein [Paenibacillus agricola]NHN32539.1 ATP-binding cassette domain-containing protein [Paenibacillus agricola]